MVARPDDKWGETPCAFVEMKPGHSASEDELIAWCRTRLAHYKCPRHIVFAEIPKTSTGKVQKFALRKLAIAAAARRDDAHASLAGRTIAALRWRRRSCRAAIPRAGEDEASRIHDVRKTLKGAAGLARLFTGLVGPPANGR